MFPDNLVCQCCGAFIDNVERASPESVILITKRGTGRSRPLCLFYEMEVRYMNHVPYGN